MKHVIEGDPLAEKDIGAQMDAWVNVLDDVVSKLHRTLEEVRAFNQRGDLPDVRDAEPDP